MNFRRLTLVIGLALMLAGTVGIIRDIRRDASQSAAPPNVAPGDRQLPAVPDQAVEPLPAGQFFGYTPDRDGTQRFLRTLDKPTLLQAAPGLFGAPADNQPVLLYRALDRAHVARYGRPYVCVKQGIGDCVSQGWAHGASVHLAVLYAQGLTSEWQLVASEPIYGGARVEASGRSSGGWGDGSYGGAAAKWVKNWGLVFRRDYQDASVDLSTYSAQLAKQWGNYGCGGKNDGGKLDVIAKLNPVRQVALVATYDEAAAAIASGYPVPVCSGQGFASRRTDGGWAEARGSWSHCMCFIGVRYQPDGLLCLNSWGPDWISGPKWPEDQPDGSFWVERKTAERMLRWQDSFAVSGFEGFPFRDLKHADWAGAPVQLKRVPDVPPTEPIFVLAP